MPSKAVVKQWRAESWSWVEAGDPEAMREDERIVDLADMLERAMPFVGYVACERQAGTMRLDAHELLREWNGPLPFEP